MLFQIELNENKLKGNDLKILLKKCPELYKIKLEHNLIEDFDNLKCLSKYEIKKIYLEGNPIVSKYKNYREKLFKLIPSLEAVDGIEKDGNDVDSSNNEGEDDDGEYEEAEEEGDISEEDSDNEDKDNEEGDNEDDA